jgi:hypothetical protein
MSFYYNNLYETIFIWATIKCKKCPHYYKMWVQFISLLLLQNVSRVQFINLLILQNVSAVH